LFFVGWIVSFLMLITFLALLVELSSDQQVYRTSALVFGLVISCAASVFGWVYFLRGRAAPIIASI